MHACYSHFSKVASFLETPHIVQSEEGVSVHVFLGQIS